MTLSRIINNFRLRIKEIRGNKMELKKKIKTAYKILKIIKNYPVYFLEYFKIIKKPFIILNFWNGISYKMRTNGMDRLIINEIWVHNQYTKEFGIKEGDTVIDIGAHIGIFSIFASKFNKKGKIFSFEPFQENFQILKENIALNNAKNIVSIKKAVSKNTGKKSLLISKNNNAANSFFINEGEKVHIKTISLKDFVEQNKIDKIDFLKIDCEGSEYEILLNCSDDLLGKIKKISMEYHVLDKKRNSNLLKNFLEKKGFNVKIQKNLSPLYGNLYAVNKKIK